MHALSSPVKVCAAASYARGPQQRDAKRVPDTFPSTLTHWSQHVSVILRIISRERCMTSCSSRNLLMAADSLEVGAPGTFMWRKRRGGGGGGGGPPGAGY
jgi:hypothetical protein